MVQQLAELAISQVVWAAYALKPSESHSFVYPPDGEHSS